MDRKLEDAFKKVKQKYDIGVTLKEQQVNIIRSLLKKKDVFALLPTGYGKSMTFTLPPLLLDEIEGGHHIALMISPLKALMADQVAQLQKRNIKAAALMDDTRDIADDESIIFVSSEAATPTKWKRLLSEKFKNQICLLAFDEAHCISSWLYDYKIYIIQNGSI